MDPNVFKAVMAVGRRMGATRKQLLAAAETGLVESGFTNPSAMTDHDSQGWRQERRSLYPNPTNVQASAARFFQEAKQHDQPGLSAGDLAAAVQRPAAQYRGRYSQAEARAAALLGMKGGDATAQAASVGSTTTNLPGATFKTTVPTVDQSGFDDARRKAIIGQLIARRNPNSILLRSGLLSTVEPSLSEFMGQQTTTSRVPGKTVTTPGAPTSGGGGRSLGGAGGAIHIAPGADRPGVSTQPIVKSFIAQVAGHAQRPLTIGTGTNHNRMTTSGNVSDHWTGHAADLPQPVDSHQGDMVAAHALQVAGVPWSQAIRMAQKGGVFNVTPSSGPYKGHRVQVLWKTMVGGNHHNHVHVGIR